MLTRYEDTSTVTWFKNFLIVQSCIALTIALGSGLGKGLAEGLEAGLSALMGGGIAILPNFIFIPLFFKVTPLQGSSSTAKFLRHPKATSPPCKTNSPQLAKQILAYFYLAEVLKLLITAILFTLAFQWGRLRPVPLFLAFAATYAGYWLIPWMTRKF